MAATAPMVGEPIAIDLVNTRTRDADLLGTPQALRRWLALEADRLPEASTAQAVPDTALGAVHAVRDHTAAAVEAILDGERPPDAALRGLESALAAAPVRTSLAWEDGAVTAVHRRDGDAAHRLAAALAEAAVALLCDPAVAKVRRCEADDCVLLFLPAHPKRRWCSAGRCGNRVRVARHYQRRKGTAPER